MASAQQMLYDWFSGPVMTDLAQSETVAAGLELVFPKKFYEISNISPVGINVDWESHIGVRSTAPIVDSLSPSVTQETQARQRQFAQAVGTRMNTPLDSELLIGLLNNVPQWQNRARQVLMQKMRDFRAKADNLKTTLVHSALALDAIYVNSAGQILPSSTGAVGGGFQFGSLYSGANALTKTSYWPGLTTGVAANQVGDWSSASLDIPASIRAMQQGYRFTSNYKPVNIIYGKSIPTFLYENTAMQTYMSRQPMINQEMLMTNEVPAGLLDMTWTPGYEAYYVDSNGVSQPFLKDNQIIITPDINANWWENFECSMPCPKGLVNPTVDFASFLASCPPVKGYSSYVIPSYDPPKATMIAQWYGWPAIKSNLACWGATTS